MVNINSIPQVQQPTVAFGNNKSEKSFVKDFEKGYKGGINKTQMAVVVGGAAALAGVVALHKVNVASITKNPAIQQALGMVKAIVDPVFAKIDPIIKAITSKFGKKAAEEAPKVAEEVGQVINQVT